MKLLLGHGSVMTRATERLVLWKHGSEVCAGQLRTLPLCSGAAHGDAPSDPHRREAVWLQPV